MTVAVPKYCPNSLVSKVARMSWPHLLKSFCRSCEVTTRGSMFFTLILRWAKVPETRVTFYCFALAKLWFCWAPGFCCKNEEFTNLPSGVDPCWRWVCFIAQFFVLASFGVSFYSSAGSFVAVDSRLPVGFAGPGVSLRFAGWAQLACCSAEVCWVAIFAARLSC